MKTIKISLLAIIIVLTGAAAQLAKPSAFSKTDKSLNGEGFVILELFTSEGCSSCPPADELLARLNYEYRNKPVYVLAYHVDYWDRNGWKDRYSNSRFSKRQYTYSKQLSAQVYTPQVVVNGKLEFIGSDESAAKNAIAVALSKPAAELFSLITNVKDGVMQVDYQLADQAENDQLKIAVVKKQATNKVEAGENGGRVLFHPQIVHDLHTFDLSHSDKGSAQFKLPLDFNNEDWEVIGFLQNPLSGEISAATRGKMTI